MSKKKIYILVGVVVTLIIVLVTLKSKGIIGSNLFMLKTSGNWDMFINAWEGILSMNLKSDEKIILIIIS